MRRERLVAPEIVPEDNESNDLFGVRSIADVPWPGTCFDAGEPVMTLMTAGADVAECQIAHDPARANVDGAAGNRLTTT